jgi:hypothetical protein
MRVFLLATLLLPILTLAQPDSDMPDTRNKRESFLKFGLKDLRADLAVFTIAGIDESVGKLPLDKVSHTRYTETSMHFEGMGVKASISTAPFDPAKHKLDYDEQYLVKIDRKTYYGGYGKVPKTQIASVNFIINTDTVVIPPTAYFDLYNLNLMYKDKKGADRTMNAIYFSKDKRTIYFYVFCKDATGSYEVTWIIQDKKYLRRVLDYGIM